MSHPLVLQLRFTRYEFHRSLRGLDPKDAEVRIMPMNCISWNIGHLAWQEQSYYLKYGMGKTLFRKIDKDFCYGAPASTPPLEEVLSAWQTITAETNDWLDTLTTEMLTKPIISQGKEIKYTFGNLLLRTIYHYWYHIGENMAIRQQLGHSNIPVFVGNLDGRAPYIPEVTNF
jgi:hypothetical protein